MKPTDTAQNETDEQYERPPMKQTREARYHPRTKISYHLYKIGSTW